MFFNPGVPMKTSMPNTSMRRNEKATGNPASRKTTRPPMKKVNTIHHSTLMSPSRMFFSGGGFAEGIRRQWVPYRMHGREEISYELKKQKKEPQWNDEKNAPHGHIDGLHVDHVSLDIFDGCYRSVPTENSAKTHPQKAVDEMEYLLCSSAEVGDNQFDRNMSLLGQKPRRPQKGCPEHGVLVELDDPDRPGESHGPREYGVAYREGHQNENDTDYDCQKIKESVQYLCHVRYPYSKNAKQ
jgi:hypothetical protein